MSSKKQILTAKSQLVDEPWLTIVTVVKDDEEGLSATANSISEQELDGVEWILVDGSSDAVERFWPKHLEAATCYICAPPRGIYQAMNLGLSKAKAPHVLFLNAGDVLADEGVLLAIRPWCQSNEGRWLYGNTELVDPTGQKRLAPRFDFFVEKRHCFRRGRFPQQPSTLYATAELLAIGGFDLGLTIAADYRAMLVLSNRQVPRFVNITITRFMLDGTSARNWRESLSQALEARREVYGLSGARSYLEWWMSRSLWMRSWLYRALPVFTKRVLRRS